MSSNTNIGNTPVNQGYVQLIHMGETGGIDGTLRALYDGDGTASDLLIASDKVKISTELYIGSKTLTEFVQDTVGAMFSSNTETNITVTYQDGDGTIDLVSSGEVTLVGSQTLTNKTLTSPVINTGISGTAFLDENDMASDSATKFASQQSIKAYVDTEVAGIVSSAPSTLDTLNELAAALGDDANFATTTATSLGEKLVKASNLSDLTNAGTARSNLGLGSGAVLNTAAVANSATTLSTGDQIYDFVIGLGYTTNVGDITGVDLTSGAGITISSETNTTSGAYSSTIATNIASTSLNVSGTGQLAINLNKSALSTATLNASDFMILFDANDSEAPKRFVAQDIFDSLGGITIDGTTANGVLTYGGTNNIDTEANLTFDGSTLALTGDLNVGSGDFFVDDSTGLVGIGTASPAEKLSISAGGTAGQEVIKIRDSGGTEKFVIGLQATTGNPTISTNDGDLYVDATHDINLDAGGGQIFFTQAGTAVGQIDMAGTDLEIKSLVSNADMFFRGNDGGSEITAIAIDMSAGGNVGIGTNSPGALLDVNGTGYIRTAVFSDAFKPYSGTLATYGSSSTDHYFVGDVGIGTASPAQKLHVAGSVMISNNTFFMGEDADGDDINLLGIHSNNNCYIGPSSNAWAGGAMLYGAASGTNAHVWYEGNAERMRIADNGFLGIGTVSPGANLDVAGSGGSDGAAGSPTIRLSNTVASGDWDTGDVVGTIEYYVHDTSGNAPYVGSFIKSVNPQDNGTLPGGYLSFGTCPYNQSGGATEEFRMETDGDFHAKQDIIAFSTTPSDRRLKKNIKDIDYGLDTIMSLNPKQYDWKKDDRHDIGFIAQEVEEVIPEIVKDKKHFDKEIKTLDYEKLTAVLIKAVQEQQDQINELKGIING